MRDIFRGEQTILVKRAAITTLTTITALVTSGALATLAVLALGIVGCSNDNPVTPSPEPACTDFADYIHVKSAIATPGLARRAAARSTRSAILPNCRSTSQ